MHLSCKDVSFLEGAEDSHDAVLLQVYKGLRDGVQEVAIKKLTHVDGWQLQQFQKEIDLLRALSYDKNVVQFFGASMQPDNPVLVLEYMGGGDLRKVLDDPKNASKLIWHRCVPIGFQG